MYPECYHWNGSHPSLELRGRAYCFLKDPEKYDGWACQWQAYLGERAVNGSLSTPWHSSPSPSATGFHGGGAGGKEGVVTEAVGVKLVGPALISLEPSMPWPPVEGLLYPYLIEKETKTEIVNNLSKVIQLINSKSRLWTHIWQIPKLSSPLRHQLIKFQRSILPHGPFAIVESGNLLLERNGFR